MSAAAPGATDPARAARFQPDAMPGYALPVFPYRTPPDLAEGRSPLHPVVIVGGGLTGLALALDLGLAGIRVVVLDEDDTVGSAGLSSRGICYAQRTLEVFDRLGVAARMMEKGVTWNEGRVFRGDEEVYAFDLQPERDRRFPAFINLQQFYVEHHLVDAILACPQVDLRWKHRVTAVRQEGAEVVATCETPDGTYDVRAEWLVAADGGRSTVRGLVGAEDAQLAFFEDRWCIADIRMPPQERPVRTFWLDSPHVDGAAVLLHQMADGVWRTDWQIGHYADSDAEATPARAVERLERLLGPDRPFELVWVGPWRFKTRWLDRFVHGRVVFVGDSAHELPPFGARGGNSGVQDADNLAWKLAMVVRGQAGPELLDTYDAERRAAAAENIAIAARTIRFVKPDTPGRALFRNAALDLARAFDWARPMVNTGRLSTPTLYADSPLNLPDADAFAARAVPGQAAPDGRVRTAGGAEGHLVERLRGFVLLRFVEDAAVPAPAPAEAAGVPVADVVVRRGRTAGPGELLDPTGALFDRYDAAGGATYVIRPDGHVMGRRRGDRPDLAGDALARVARTAAPAGREAA